MKQTLCDFCGKPVVGYPIVGRFPSPHDDYEIRITSDVCNYRKFDGRGPLPQKPDVCVDCMMLALKAATTIK